MKDFALIQSTKQVYGFVYSNYEFVDINFKEDKNEQDILNMLFSDQENTLPSSEDYIYDSNYISAIPQF